MTNHWIDIKNADVVLAIGCNPAENHPVSMRWVQHAIENRNGKLICVDPRFTRTAAVAHVHAPIRSGTDIAFVGGIIRYALETGRINRTYLEHYTNAPYRVSVNNHAALFDVATGLFTGFAGGAYNLGAWSFKTDRQEGTDGAVTTGAGTLSSASATFTSSLVGRTLYIKSGAAIGKYTVASVIDTNTVTLSGLTAAGDETGLSWYLPGQILMDPSMTAPDCALELLRQHFSRYTPEMVEQVTGCPRTKFLEVAELVTSTCAPNKAATIMYAMGATQHTNGSQNIRAYGILQLLLGNMGVAGGGINALRGESNVQGSTDHAILYHILPGYLPMCGEADATLGVDVSASNGIRYAQDEHSPAFLTASAADQATAKASYLWKKTKTTGQPASVNWWKNTPRYVVSLLKAYYGDNMPYYVGDAAATNAAIEEAYTWLPKIEAKDYSILSIFERLRAGSSAAIPMEGMILMGMNPVVGGANSDYNGEAMANLDWLVAVDLWETESSIFWKRPGVDPATIDTEVWLLPAAGSFEKSGSVSNSGRWAQWRYKAVEPPGEAKTDLWIISKLFLKVKELYAAEVEHVRNHPILKMPWPESWADELNGPTEVAKWVNGYAHADFTSGRAYTAGELMDSFAHLTFDGRTSSACWIYTQSFTKPALTAATGPGGNNMARRDSSNGTDVSGDLNNKIGLFATWAWSWPVNRRLIYNRASVDPLTGLAWDPQRRVIGTDPVTFAPVGGDVVDGGGNLKVGVTGYVGPYIMKPNGVANIFGPDSLKDGPFPEHYEPMESPVVNPLNGSQNTPVVYKYAGDLGVFATSLDFPLVGTTYRVTEHWQAGAMTRNLPWLGELMPYMFVEMSHELAEAKGIANGDEVVVRSRRGSARAYAIVTKRVRPFTVNGQTVHLVGLPWHWGYAGLFTGDSANSMTPHVGDVNTRIPEYKAFLCDVSKA